MSSQDLEKLLSALRAESRGIEAPKYVETALRSAFRAHAQRPARSQGLRWALSAAAVVAVLIGAAAWKMGQPLPPPPPVRLTVAPPTPMPPPAIALGTARPLVARRVNRPSRPRVAPARPAPPPREVATEFMPIEDSMNLSPIESGQVLRVDLPRSTMMRFGFPVNQDRMLEPVKADVVFAQDGIARAIRFVK
jgi:hypothetical protein